MGQWQSQPVATRHSVQEASSGDGSTPSSMYQSSGRKSCMARGEKLSHILSSSRLSPADGYLERPPENAYTSLLFRAV